MTVHRDEGGRSYRLVTEPDGTEQVQYLDEVNEHTILVAFTVEAPTRAKAHESLIEDLAQACLVADSHTSVTSWWVAEDDRTDVARG